MDVSTLADLLQETAEHHDRYEKTHPNHNWWDWYAPYLNARQNGSMPEQASLAAGCYMQQLRNGLTDDVQQPVALPARKANTAFGQDWDCHAGTSTDATPIGC